MVGDNLLHNVRITQVGHVRHCFAPAGHLWTESDTKAYWSEVERELANEHVGAQYLIDPKSTWLIEDRALGAASPSAPSDPARQAWSRLLSLVPVGDRDVLQAYVAIGLEDPRRTASLAAGMGLSPSDWFYRIDAAVQRAKVVQEAAWRGWDRRRVLRHSKRPEAVAAYLESWSTSGAAKQLGVRQSTVYYQLSREPGLVLRSIMNRPNIVHYSGSLDDL